MMRVSFSRAAAVHAGALGAEMAGGAAGGAARGAKTRGAAGIVVGGTAVGVGGWGLGVAGAATNGVGVAVCRVCWADGDSVGRGVVGGVFLATRAFNAFHHPPVEVDTDVEVAAVVLVAVAGLLTVITGAGDETGGVTFGVMGATGCARALISASMLAERGRGGVFGAETICGALGICTEAALRRGGGASGISRGREEAAVTLGDGKAAGFAVCGICGFGVVPRI